MLLDAPTYKTELTPEAALAMVQREVRSRGWPKYEVEEIRLIYTPFYSFSFDVSSQGAEPVSGRAALNGSTGEINEMVQMVLDKPWTRAKESEQGGEVEETTIPRNEVKDTAAAKIAAQTGLKKDMATVSAISKVYLPAYRIWVSVAGDTFKVEIDALMGIPAGLEAIPARPKTWNESAKETVDKMKTPAGIIELAGKTGKTVAGMATGKGGPASSQAGKWVILIVIIVALLVFLLVSKQGGANCKGSIQDFGNECRLEGTCDFSNPGSDIISLQSRIAISEEGKERLDLGTLVGVQLEPKQKTTQGFSMNWSSLGKDCQRAFSWKSNVLS